MRLVVCLVLLVRCRRLVVGVMNEPKVEKTHIACRWCPPSCKSCEPDDCECYTHQDWPDASQEDDFYASRLRLCIDASGCDGRSHDIRCNEVLYA